MDKKIVYATIAIIVFILVAMFLMFHGTSKKESTVNIPMEKLVDTNTIQMELNVNKQNAKEIATQIKEVSSGTKEPTTTFTMPSMGVERAVEVVQEKIRDNDTTLPSEVLENTDNTIVSTDTDGTKVEVYKINTYRNWEAGIGIGKLNGETYIPVALQRNYDRCHSVEVQANLDTNGRCKGGQVMWKVHF